MPFEKLIFKYFSQIFTFGYHRNKTKTDIWIILLCQVEDFIRIISIKELLKYLQRYSNKCNFSIFLQKANAATLSSHSNQTVGARAIKNTIFVDTNTLNIYANFQLHGPYAFWEVDF